MARKSNVVPSYLLHKQSGQARCRVAGKDYLLGPYGSEESRVKFGEIVAKIVSGQSVDPFVAKSPATSQAESSLTVNELVLAYMRHAQKHYVKNGQETSEIHCLKSATRPLVELYGYHSVDAFGPLALKAVREKMISSGWCRKTVNKNVGRLRSIFRYGVENELVSPATLQKLTAVAPLLAGRTEAPDNAPRTPATETQIQAVKPFVWRRLRCMAPFAVSRIHTEICNATCTQLLWLAVRQFRRSVLTPARASGRPASVR
ncbi:MAG: hypothetical protein WCK86_13210, partial [Planctomycetia bacterium]